MSRRSVVPHRRSISPLIPPGKYRGALKLAGYVNTAAGGRGHTERTLVRSLRDTA